MADEVGNEDLVDKLRKLEILLDEYEHKIHLDKAKVINVDLEISRQTLMSMHYEDLQGLLWEYGQYTLALQREINKHQSRYNWADANLKRAIERGSVNYDYWKWEEKLANALNDSDYAQKLHNLKVKSKAVIDRLAFIPARVQFLCECMRDIINTKRYKKYDE